MLVAVSKSVRGMYVSKFKKVFMVGFGQIVTVTNSGVEDN